MPLTDFLVPEGVLPQLRATSKKQVLRELSDQAGSILKLESRSIFEALLQRERLGLTGIGKGLSLIHI